MGGIIRLTLIIGTSPSLGQQYIHRTHNVFHSQVRSDLAALLTYWQARFHIDFIQPRLELDLGVIPANQFEAEFSTRLRQYLGQWLAQQVWQQSDSEDIRIPMLAQHTQCGDNNVSNRLYPATHIAEDPSPEILRQAFIRYLSQGFWPWPQLWLPVLDSASAMQKHRSAQRWLIEQWQRDSIVWKQALWGELVSADARERLWRLLSPPVRRRLIHLLWPQAPRGESLSALTLAFVHRLQQDNNQHGQQYLERENDNSDELNANARQGLALDGSVSFWDNERVTAGTAAADIAGADRQRGDEKGNAGAQSQNVISGTVATDSAGADRQRGDKKGNAGARNRSSKKVTAGMEAENVRVPEIYRSAGRNDAFPGLPLTTTLTVAGAGMVLCWSMLPALFSQLWPQGMDDFARHQAVQLLDNLIWQDEVPAAEWRMASLRILCGLPPEVALPPDITINEEQREQGARWLVAVMAQLPPLQRFSSLTEWESELFCALFLQRPGILSYQDDGWYWQVTSEPYDLLLLELQWPLDGFTLQRPLLPWLATPISVSWPLPESACFL
ncbi:contractile injection system tape measure protein [Escherichia sp. E1130]|uniref:contractile injection system tape measure protein n=1 Tax=Escherichia sp. E1130 TaxID=2041645 RepID=UPI0014369AB4|nr:contractile injection system tape measure protein [Escherichia sp. E1130]